MTAAFDRDDAASILAAVWKEVGDSAPAHKRYALHPDLRQAIRDFLGVPESSKSELCPSCGLDAVVVVKALTDYFGSCDETTHPVDDFTQDYDKDTATHMAHGCVSCGWVVPDSHWIEG